MQYGQLLLFQWYLLYDEEFEDTKGVIRICKPKNRQHNGQKTEEQTTQWPKRKRTKGKTTIYKYYT